MELYEKINQETGLFYESNSYIDFKKVICGYSLSESLLCDIISYFEESECDKFISHYISSFQKLSEDFIEKYYLKLNCTDVCIYQVLSEKFIESHWDWFSSQFRLLLSYQKFSEEFIERYSYALDYDVLLKYHKISHDFFNKHWSVFNPSVFMKYQKVSEEMFSEQMLSMYHFDKSYIENNWIYKSTEEKRQAVIDTGLYECYDDYFIAYKAIRSDRYSLYNFQYKYEKGGVYESWCDCTDDENSFGLNVGSKKSSMVYGELMGNYMIVRCKVRYEDVGRIVHDGEKIRCFKIEIMD